MRKEKRTGVIEREIHKLRHLEKAENVDRKLLKQESDTETARDRKCSFDWVKAEDFYLFSSHDTAYREPRCSALSNNAFFKMV